MNFGTKGCMYNCGDECTGECIKVETKTKMSKEETINKTLEDIKNVKLYTEEQVIEILWECVDNIESSYNIHEVTEEFIKNKAFKPKQR